MRHLYVLLLFCLCYMHVAAQQTAFTEYNINPKGDSRPHSFYKYNGKLFFVATHDTAGAELWVSDGTKAGTRVIKDIYPGKNSSDPVGYGAIDGLLFGASDSFGRGQLWKTNGTENGTFKLKDVKVRFGTFGDGTYYKAFVPYKDKLYFCGADSGINYGLWCTDGTTAGTKLVKSKFDNGKLWMSADIITECNGKLYFSGAGFNGRLTLYVSDGTEIGTTPLMSAEGSIGLVALHGLTAFNNKLYFIATDKLHGQEIWVSDGTVAGTKIFIDIEPGVVGGARAVLRVYNNRLYFTKGALTNVNNFMWSTDGTVAGTITYRSVHFFQGENPYGEDYNASIVYKGKLYFCGNDSVDPYKGRYSLYSTDGMPAATLHFKDTSIARIWSPYCFTAYNDRFYFRASDDLTADYQIYVSNATDTGTHVVRPSGTTVKGLPSFSTDMCVFNGQLYFGQNYNGTDYDLWSLRDTAAPWPPKLDIASTNGSKEEFNIYPNPNNGHLQ